LTRPTFGTESWPSTMRTRCGMRNEGRPRFRALKRGNFARFSKVDVLTAFGDNAHELDDPALLDRATVLGRTLFTQDDDLLVEAQRRQRQA
ncbi:MAG: hypothetical protein AB4911_09780, partial [Oscillochloridaceae bacterium umkhey_bin13]